MKTIARTLVILLTAGLIALGWTAYAATNSGQTSMPERPAEFAPADDGTADPDQTLPPRPDGDRMGFSVDRVLGGMAVIIAQTALVIALVVGARKLGNWLSDRYFKQPKTRRREYLDSHLSFLEVKHKVDSHPGFSKYCIGVSLLYPAVKHNRFKPKLQLINKLMKETSNVYRTH